MVRRSIGLGLAALLGVAGFAFAIRLDKVGGAASWPWGPEIVVVVAIVATLAATMGLAWGLGWREWRRFKLAIVVAGAGFGVAYAGFLGLFGIFGGCGYTPDLDAETYLEGDWDDETARSALEAAGLAVRDVDRNSATGSTTLDGDTTFRVHIADARYDRDRGSAEDANASLGVRISASFWPEESYGSSDAAQNWTEEERPRLEERFETLLADVEAETGWQRTGNVTWDAGTVVC